MKPCKHTEPVEGCRFCYLFAHDERYTKLWSDPSPEPKPPEPSPEPKPLVSTPKPKRPCACGKRNPSEFRNERKRREEPNKGN